MQTRGAGGDDSEIGTFEAVFDRQMAGDHVDDRGRHEKRTDAARAAVGQLFVRLFNHRQTTDAGPYDDANALGVGIGYD